MSLVDWVNRQLTNFMRREVKPVLAGDEIVVKGKRYALEDATGIAAYEADVYAGWLVCLLLSFADGTLIRVNQDDAWWNDLLAALDRLGLTKVPSSEWMVQIISGVQNTPIALGK